MQIAFAAARAAAAAGEVPVGAVLVSAGGDIIAQAGNNTESAHDPTGHAEMLVIRAACAVLSSPRLPECDLYVTLEPCAMCAAAISFARIRRLYFAAYDPKGGGGGTWCPLLRLPHLPPRPRNYWRYGRNRGTETIAAVFSAVAGQ